MRKEPENDQIFLTFSLKYVIIPPVINHLTIKQEEKDMITFEVLDRFDPFKEFLLEGGNKNYHPASDFYETEKSFVVEIGIPGVKAEDIDIQIENGVLTVKGERKLKAEIKSKNNYHLERSYGSFLRSFTLPKTVNQEAEIDVEYKDGVLTIVLPKKEEVKPKKITIKAGK